MKHRVVGRRLDRTTDAKAKELKRWGDRMITLGKDGTLHARRRAAALVRRNSVVRKLFAELAQRYTSRAGGYVRVVKLGVRAGDAASMSLVELVDRPGSGTDGTGKKKKAPRRKDAAKTETPRRRAAAG